VVSKHKRKAALYAIGELLNIRKQERSLDSRNRFRLFVESGEDACKRRRLPSRVLLKLYILFKINPKGGGTAFHALLEKVMRIARAELQLAEHQDHPHVPEVATHTPLSSRVRKLAVNDMLYLLEWFVALTETDAPIPFVRDQLQGIVVVVGEKNRFEYIDDDVLWKDEYEDLLQVIEEAILDKSFVRIKSFVNHFCFDCIPYNTESATLLTMSDRLVPSYAILCSLGHSQLDFRANLELMVKSTCLLFELCKFLKGQKEELIKTYLNTLLSRVIIPKLERALVSNKNELVGEDGTMYLKSMEFCKLLKTASSSSKEEASWCITRKELEDYLRLCS